MQVRDLFKAGEIYKYAIYAGLFYLFASAFSEPSPDHLSYSVIALLASVIALYKLGKLPEYSKTIQVDPLTGLVNRTGFLNSIKEALAMPSLMKAPVVVIVVDLNNFKGVNESLGYDVGDELLKLVSLRLQSVTTERDIVARIGSDEFGLVLGPSAIGYMTVCTKLYATFSEPFIVAGGIAVTLGISTGVVSSDVAFADSHKDLAHSMILGASIALSHSKKAKTGPIIFTPHMDTRSSESLSIASSLKPALERNEFLFHYQPQYNAATGKIVGAEALMRWQHPVFGFLSPDRFIPIAEQSNQIQVVTSWTLREGIQKLAKFREIFPGITLSINISPYAISNSDILVSLTKEIVYNSIPHNSLIVEITESSIDKSPEDMSKIIACLEMLGIQISIDDFGTGHASLLYLKHLPLKEIKIDKVFVQSMSTSAADLAIVSSTIKLGHGMSCMVVAEGVEDEVTRQMLQELGCDILQGYLYSKPLTEDAFVSLLESEYAVS